MSKFIKSIRFLCYFSLVLLPCLLIEILSRVVDTRVFVIITIPYTLYASISILYIVVLEKRGKYNLLNFYVFLAFKFLGEAKHEKN